MNVGGTRNVMEEALRAGVGRRSHLQLQRGRGGEARETVDEDSPFTIGRLGISYIIAKHEAELVAMRIAAKGLPVVVVNPILRLRPR